MRLSAGRDEGIVCLEMGWPVKLGRYVALDAPVQPTGADYYGARCGMVHTYGSASRKSRKGACRQIFYKFRRPGPSVHFIPEPPYPELEGGCFVVSVEALTEAFFRGVPAGRGRLDKWRRRRATPDRGDARMRSRCADEKCTNLAGVTVGVDV